MLKDLAEDRELEDHDLLVLVLMGHGETVDGQPKYMARDGEMVDIPQVISQFNNKKCPFLKGKPKLVFIQSCRGGELRFYLT